MGLPHFSHFSLVGSTLVASPESGFVFLQLGYAEHARNFPCLPVLTTIALPHFSHF